MEIKDILKKRRIELGLTQLDVANAVGVSEATVSRWESGDIENMRRSRIAALANALRISPAIIMGWDDDQSYPVTPQTTPLHIAGRDDPFYRYRTAYAKAPPAIKNAVHVTLDALLEPYEPAAIAARAKKGAAVDKSGVDLNAAPDEDFTPSGNDIP